MNNSYSHFSSIQNQIPELIKFGTSSWTYPGWQSMVYNKPYKSEAAFKRQCLIEYSRCPLFQIAGLDSSFYAPLSKDLLDRYMSQIPETFSFLVKAWEDITVPKFSNLPRYGKKAGKPNENFLSLNAFEKFYAPIFSSNFNQHIAVVVFQFQRLRGNELDGFVEKLDKFLEQLPKDLRFAVEIRNPELLSPAYFAALNRNNVTHCFNHWTDMPSLCQQMKAAATAGGLNAPFFASRILTPLGVSYADAVKRFAPYSKLQNEIPEMRRDVVRLAKRALERKVPAFIVVNNRSEGCSPATIDSLRLMISNQINTSE